jgi:hypothetical protein
MNSTSAIVNKSLRIFVSPTLRNLGFNNINARNGWRWVEKVIWVFNIRAVGSYFSLVTGWPPGSVSVNLGIFYTFMPKHPDIKTDNKGRLTPRESTCQLRNVLQCNIDQKARPALLSNPAERQRNDIWWIESDGNNANEIAINISRVLMENGIPWFTQFSNLEKALMMIEKYQDCYNKFAISYFIAKEIGDKEREEKYFSLTEAECTRNENSKDQAQWYVFG